MNGWRERAADIFAEHREIAAKMKSASGPVPSDFPSDFPASDANGVVNLGDATVKEAIVKEVLDPEEGAVLALTPDAPSITTAETRAGLTYTFYEGTTLQNMTPKATKVGDGNVWMPEITVKGGTSGFYSVHVTK